QCTTVGIRSSVYRCLFTGDERAIVASGSVASFLTARSVLFRVGCLTQSVRASRSARIIDGGSEDTQPATCALPQLEGGCQAASRWRSSHSASSEISTASVGAVVLILFIPSDSDKMPGSGHVGSLCMGVFRQITISQDSDHPPAVSPAGV